MQTMLPSRDYHPNFVGEKAGVSDNYFPKFMKLREDPNLGAKIDTIFRAISEKKKDYRFKYRAVERVCERKGC